MASIAVIYTTVNNLEQAKNLSHQAMLEKKAFCVNIIPHGLSIYEWEGKTYEEEECYLIFKTSTANQQPLIEWLTQHHPYTLPIILSSNPTVNPAYEQTMVLDKL